MTGQLSIHSSKTVPDFITTLYSSLSQQLGLHTVYFLQQISSGIVEVDFAHVYLCRDF